MLLLSTKVLSKGTINRFKGQGQSCHQQGQRYHQQRASPCSDTIKQGLSLRPCTDVGTINHSPSPRQSTDVGTINQGLLLKPYSDVGTINLGPVLIMVLSTQVLYSCWYHQLGCFAHVGIINWGFALSIYSQPRYCTHVLTVSPVLMCKMSSNSHIKM